MKKILSFTLVLILLLSAVLSVSAYEEPTGPFEWDLVDDPEVIETVRNSFKEYCIEKHHWLSSDDEAIFENEMYIKVICTQDEATVFYGCVGGVAELITNQLIGQYLFINGAIYGDEYTNPIGFYALLNDGKIIDLIDAYNEGLINIDDVAAHYPWHTKLSDREYDVVTKLSLANNAFYGCGYYYKELFLITTDEEGATPDIVLIEAGGERQHAGTYTEVIGDYVVATRINFSGDKLPYYLYTHDQRLLTLKEAYEEGNPYLMEAVINSEIPYALKGDSDADRELTIKDATHIQKKLAEIQTEKNYENTYIESAVEDFDEDGTFTISDATAIQKHLAGLEY